MKPILQKTSVKRIFKISALTGTAALLLLLAGLIFLPNFVSSSIFQSQLKKTLSVSMKRQVGWSSLVMTWSDGLSLTGLRLAEGAAPLLKADIDHIVIAPSAGRGADGRIGIDLSVRVKNIRAELAPGPPKPQPTPGKDPLTQLAEVIQKVHGVDLPLPVDIRINIEVTPLQVVYRKQSEQLALQDFSLRLAVPSLATKPVTAEISGGVSNKGREIGKISFKARVSDLVTREQRIRLNPALFAVEASAPGTAMTVSGGLGQADGFSARVKFNLPVLLAAARPLIPSTVPNIEGTVEFLLHATSDAKRDLHASLSVEGTSLAASGGLLKAKRVGATGFKLEQRITSDHIHQRVDFPKGKLSIPAIMDVAWSASVNRPSLPERSVELQVGPLDIDLGGMFSLAAPFLPTTLPVTKFSGDASLRSLVLTMKGPGNTGSLAADGLGVKLPNLKVTQKSAVMSADGIELLIEKINSPLAAGIPTGFAADLLWNIKGAAVSGSQPLQLQGGHGKIGIEVTNLNLRSSSPRRITASAVLSQSVDFDRVSLGTQLVVDKFHEQLRFAGRATELGDIEASLPEFVASAASVQATQGAKKFAPMPFSASASADAIHLPFDSHVKPSLQRAVLTITVADSMQFTAEASLSAVLPQLATSKGSARFDLQRSLPFAAPFVPSGLKCGGIVAASWDLAALLPEKGYTPDRHPLKNAKALLSLFDKLEFALKLENVSVAVPSTKGLIKVAAVTSKPDFRVVSTKKGESIRFEGGLLLSGLNGLLGGSDTLLNSSFLVTGEFSGWSALHVKEKLRIEPLTFSQEAELTVGRIDTLFEENQPFSTATLLKRLDASMTAAVDGTFSRELKQLLPGIDISGSLNSSVNLNLSAGRELGLRSTLKSKDFGLQLANGTKVEGMRFDIAVNRQLALAAASRSERWTPLSNALVRPSAAAIGNPGATEIAARISDDLRGDLRGARSFSIQRVTAKTSSGTPLQLTALEGDLLFTQEKTGISFLQADLLGGTLLARAVFDLRPEVPTVSLGSSFSNLDITRLLPKENRKLKADHDAEITGEMTLVAPLTAEQRELFEQLRLSLNMRKIGANTIERALFSLDPYERNEQVVAQRKMLRLGGLKGLRATAVDGAFSMEGEAHIKGVAIELPKVERLRISELPLRQEVAKNSKHIATLRSALDLMRADTLVVGTKGELSLQRRKYAR